MKHLWDIFSKNQVYGYKKNSAFQGTNLISQKEGFGLLTVYIANSCNCDLISFICDNVGGI